MNKVLIFLLVLVVLSCKKEPTIKGRAIVSAQKPLVEVEGKSVQIDTVLLNSYNNQNLKDFYLSSGFKSVWQSKKKRKIIIDQLLSSKHEGLNPAHYKVKTLLKYQKKYENLDDKEKAIYDILLTQSLQKYIAHLSNGRLNPRHLYKDWDLKENKIDLNKTLVLLLKSDSLAYKIEQLKPNHIVYKSLKKALRIINSFPKDNFKTIEISKKIVLNDTNLALIDIKKRLIYWKEMTAKDSLTAIYDSKTFEAMKKFQIRHGLAADGVVGAGTVQALNFSKRKRKEQILANLERWKWFPKKLGKEYLIVNIPDYKLSLVKDKDSLRTHKVIVGRAKRATPILSSTLSNVILNPTWTVPPTILKEDVIPSISKNWNYLTKTNMKVFDGNGNEVSANNWNPSKAKSYRYVQSPGSFNSLGMVKFSFPNQFSVYLHDTNHRDFFGKQNRSLSSGCVRIENPLELAEYLLDDKDNWNTKKITEILQNKKTKYIKIKNKVDVHILYWTAWSENNSLIFRDDIYNLDAELCLKLGL